MMRSSISIGLLVVAVGSACSTKSVEGGNAFGPTSATEGPSQSGSDSVTGDGQDSSDGSTSTDGPDDDGETRDETTTDDPGDGSTTGDGGEAGSTGDGADPGEPSFGSGSAFDDVMQMFDYFNESRTSYLSHERWRGMPFFGGEGHTTTTWPVTFAWDDALAAQAQAEADGLAAGAAPRGEPASDGFIPPIYLFGVDTAHYMISGTEAAGTWEQENLSSLGRQHGAARMSMYYHDPGGQGPVLSRIGIGAADAGDGGTRWVIVLE